MRRTTAIVAQDPEQVARPSEGACLAREITKARDAHIRWYAGTYEMTPKQSFIADQQWVESQKEKLKNLIDKPSDEVTWCDLDMAETVEEGLTSKIWTKLKADAAEELDCGWRSAKIVEADGWKNEPIDRARFFAILNSFYDEWQPRPGTETMMVNMLAQIYYTYEQWLRTHHNRILFTGVGVTREEAYYRKGKNEYITARLTESEAIEQSAAMADRWQRAFLRTVRALRDLRRLNPPVVIQNAEQVNVGQQQINLKRD